MLGPVSVSRDGARGAAAALAQGARAARLIWRSSPSAVSRSRLCDLLWDVPNDPRGELRWCLSKLRGVLDDAERRRVVTARGRSRSRSICPTAASTRSRSTGSLQAGHRERLAASGSPSCATRFGGDLLDGLRDRRQPGVHRLARRAAPALPRAARRGARASWRRARPRARTRRFDASRRGCSSRRSISARTR